MSKATRKSRPLHERTLNQLCNLIIEHKYPFEDLAEFIEDRAYEVCESSGNDCREVVRQLRKVVAYFSRPGAGSDKRAQTLTDLYVLMGEMYLYHDRPKESLTWFRKAIHARENYAAPYHSLALAQAQLGDLAGAARSLEEELIRAPGNLYSYLILADTYERMGDSERFEETLHRVLARDPDNLQALHRSIRHYEREQPEADVEFLRRRLLSVDRDMNRTELTIWTYHMCREGKFLEALEALQHLGERAEDSPTVHLLKAAVYGEMRQYTRKKRELALFKRINHGSVPAMRGELRQFEQVFGRSAVTKLSRRLAVTSPSAS